MAVKKKPENVKEIRIVWGSPDDLQALYANQLQVSHAGEVEFHITFGHLTPPLTHGLLEDEFPDKIEIKPVANIVVSPDAMKAFVDVLLGNYKEYSKKKGLKGE